MSVSKAILVILVCISATCRSSFASNIKKSISVGTSTCSDDDDCNNGQCVTHSDGAKTCECSVDAWVGTYCNILEWTLHSCTTLPCAQGVCHEHDSHAECICNNGWSGIKCDLKSESNTGSSSSSSGYESHTGSSSSVSWSTWSSSGSSSQTGSSSSSGDCVDHHWRCKEWADNQQCHINPGYMFKYCKQSCNTCHTAGSHTTDHCNNDCLHGQCTHYTTGDYYSCTCDAGWKGGFCQFQDISGGGHTDHCHNDCKHGNCTYSSYYNSYSCTCEAGWLGSYCDSQARCGQHHCMHGRCVHYTNGYRNCRCDHGWTGYECNQAVDGTHKEHCMNNCQHGHCELPSGQTHYLCSCDAGWTGFDCDSQAGSHTTDHCNNDCLHGQCTHYTTGDYYSCTCDAGWKGGFCQFQGGGHTDHCHIDCKHGNCTYSSYSNSYSCACEAGWLGSHCDSQARCGQHHCMHGRCVHYTNGYRNCRCDHGWTGYECNQAVDGTHKEHCMNNCQHGHCELPSGQTHYLCSCDAGWTGFDCDCQENPTTTTTATTATPTTISTRSTTTTATPTTMPMTSTPTTTTSTLAPASATSPLHSSATLASTVAPHYNLCQKLSTINDIAIQNIATNTNASVCVNSGKHSSPEAFVLNNCHTTIPSLWKQGSQIMADCHAIPAYTPIATFVNGQYSSSGGLSGIFVGCLPTGFKMAIQHCDQPPIIEHIEQGGIYTNNPDVYFTVQ